MKTSNLLTVMVIFILLVCSSNTKVHAQPFWALDTNLCTIKAFATNYFDQQELLYGSAFLEAEGSEYNQYMAWLNYWEPRVYSDGDLT